MTTHYHVYNGMPGYLPNNVETLDSIEEVMEYLLNTHAALGDDHWTETITEHGNTLIDSAGWRLDTDALTITSPDSAERWHVEECSDANCEAYLDTQD